MNGENKSGFYIKEGAFLNERAFAHRMVISLERDENLVQAYQTSLSWRKVGDKLREVNILNNDNLHGYQYIRAYSDAFIKLICSVARSCEREIFLDKPMKGVGIFLFGSPSRQEMISDSDVDILLVRDKNTKNFMLFRDFFIKKLERYNFPKIDIPDWGTLKECDTYSKFSVTEGNQVLESKFIYGDILINAGVDEIKRKYCTIDKFERVICFQKFYFDQYYKQKTRKGSIRNVKYGHGGTRDFLFANWFACLVERKQNFTTAEPLIKESLLLLYKNGILTLKEFTKYLKSCEIVTILRSEILLHNRNTLDEGLTYLDKRSLNNLIQTRVFRAKNLTELKRYCINHLLNVKKLKDKIWMLFEEHLEKSRGKGYIERFKKLEMSNIERAPRSIEEEDVLMQIALIWGLDKKKHSGLLEKLLEKYSDSQRWEVLCSICCHKDCPAPILDKIATNQGFKKGYEYLLRITARNKNTAKATLRKIALNDQLEYRFRIVAENAYKEGVKKANETL